MKRHMGQATQRSANAPSRLSRAGMAAGGVVLLLGMSLLLVALPKGRDVVPLAMSSPTPASTQVASQAPSTNLPLLDAATTFSQTIDSYTVTIGPRPKYERAADATTLFLPYTVTNWQGMGYTASAARLADIEGQNGPRLVAVADVQQPLTWVGTTVIRDIQRIPSPMPLPFDGQPAMVFDASSLQSMQAEHVLELTVNLHIADSYPPSPSGAGIITRTTQSGTETIRNVTAGPFVFRFRLPFEQLSSATDVHQTVNAGGVPVTLERVVASAQEARVLLTFASPDGSKITEWQPVDVLLSGDGIERVMVSSLGSSLQPYPGSVNGHGSRIDGWLNDRLWAGSAFEFAGAEDFLDGGKWTLVVGALFNSLWETKRIDGPWVFEFTMPPFAPRPTPLVNVTYVPGIPVPTTQAQPQVSHEPFPTVPLPGPVETASANPVGQPPPPTIPRLPVPIETAQAIETSRASYPTALAIATLTRSAIPTPPGTSDRPLRLNNLRRLTLHHSLDAENLNAINPPALSPQGDALLVSTRDHRLLLVGLDGSSPVELADEVTQYAWSTDDLYVVYAHMEPMGSPSYVQVPYSVTRDGKTRHKLDFESGNIGLLPDVGKDATWEVRWWGKGKLWRVPLDGSKSEFVVSMPEATLGAVRITPDGKRMAYLCNGGVCLQDMDGSNWTKLLTQPYTVTWSRDGSMLAVLTMHNLLLYNADGTMRTSSQYAMMPSEVIPSITREEITLEWTADSRFLLTYVGGIARYGRQDMLEIDTQTGHAWGGLAPDWATSFSIAPDGNHLILSESASEFWITDLAP